MCEIYEVMASTQHKTIKIGAVITQAKAFFDFFKSVEQNTTKFTAEHINPIGLKPEIKKRTPPTFKQMRPKSVV